MYSEWLSLIIAMLNNIAIGLTAFFILWNNIKFLPAEIRPGWVSRVGMICCGCIYLGLAELVFYHKQLPIIIDLLGLQ